MAMYGYTAYKATQVQTASQENLLLMLYDGAITALNQALAALEEGDLSVVHQRLIKTQAILEELMGALNMDMEISHGLYALYEYAHQRLVAANVAKEAEPIQEVLGYLTELRDTWQQALNAPGTSNTASTTMPANGGTPPNGNSQVVPGISPAKGTQGSGSRLEISG